MNDSLDDILRQHARPPRLGALQLARLRQVTSRCHGIVDWDGVSAVSQPGAAVIVFEATHAVRVQALIESLHENAIVILLVGESPAFDGLKSKLHAHGSLGAEGADAPHQVWWGGVKPLTVPTGLYRKQDTLFISSFESSDIQGEDAGLTADLKRLGLDHIVTQISPNCSKAWQGTSKVDFIIEQWSQACRPVFWIDAQARLANLPLLPQALGCDFAVNRRPNGVMNTGALFFHQTERAEELLDIWRRLTCSHPNLPESFLLDQAWALTNAQREIETAWLPDTYWRKDDVKPRIDSTILAHACNNDDHPLEKFAEQMQLGRRFGRHQAPEAHLVMKGAAGGRGLITIVIRDILAGSTTDIAESVEAAAAAFAADNGGFSQMEIVLCGWDDEVRSVLQIEDYAWTLMTDVSERLRPNCFSSLKRRRARHDLHALEHTSEDETEGKIASAIQLVDPSLGAKLKRSGTADHIFIRKPA